MKLKIIITTLLFGVLVSLNSCTTYHGGCKDVKGKIWYCGFERPTPKYVFFR